MYTEVLADIPLTSLVNIKQIADQLETSRVTVRRYLQGDWPEGELSKIRGKAILQKAIQQLKQSSQAHNKLQDFLSDIDGKDDQNVAQAG